MGPRDESEEKDRLDRAVRGWRGASAADALSADSRSRIFQAVREGAGPGRPLSRLFVPLHRWVVAACLPVALTAVFVGLYGWTGGEGYRPPSPDRVVASKVGGHVVFRVVNGGEAHTVARSDRPDAFGQATENIAAGGSFVDRLDGADIVFYRID